MKNDSNRFKKYIFKKPIIITVLFLISLIIIPIFNIYVNNDVNNDIYDNLSISKKMDNDKNNLDNRRDISNFSSFCPENYVAVPGGFDVDKDGINEKAYCIMKYEAKKEESNKPVSIPEKRPWVNISQIDAREKCNILGEGYSLITNKQWIQIAKIAAFTRENWISGVVGEGSLIRGHSDKKPYNTLEATYNNSNGFYNTGVNVDNFQRRTFIIKNNILGNDSDLNDNYTGVIWDFAGNIWEWNNDTINCSNNYPCPEMPKPSYESRNYELPELTEAGTYFKTLELLRPNPNWSSNENIGRIYLDSDKPIPEDNIHALARGGIWYDEDDAGLFTAFLGVSPSFSKYTIGFRCTYTPINPNK